MKRLVIGIAATSIMTLTGLATAQVINYPHAVDGKAAIACGFENDLIFAHKMDQVGKYVTNNYISHHDVGIPTTDAATWAKILSQRPAIIRPDRPANCGDTKIVLTQGDYVLFLRETIVRDPKDPTQRVPGVHFDVWRFEGDKIAEHWD